MRFIRKNPISNGVGTGLDVHDVVNRIVSVPTLLSVALGVGIIGLLLWRVLDFEWDDFISNLSGINWWLFILAAVLYYTSFWFRGLRWQLIYKGVATQSGDPDSANSQHPTALTMAGLILSGWFINSVMFFRIGDAYRGWALSDRTSSDMPTALGTVFAERVQDMVVVLVLVIVSAAWALMVDGFAASGAIVDVAIVVIAVASGLVLLLFAILGLMGTVGESIARLLPPKIQMHYLRFQTGTLDSFRGDRKLLQTALGIVGWLLEVGRFYFVAQAIGFEMALSIAMFAALANAIMTTIPVPGGLGFVETVLVTVLVLTGLSHTDSFTLTLLDRSISWLSIIGIGGAVFVTFTITRGIRQRVEMVPGCRE